MNKYNKLCLNFLILIIRIYQYSLSKYIGSNCRYLPSCSEYMIISLKNYGIFQGIYFGIKRLSKCHPWGKL